jgi:hypothetical protein
MNSEATGREAVILYSKYLSPLRLLLVVGGEI